MALSGSRDFNISFSQAIEDVGLMLGLSKALYQSNEFGVWCRRKANLLLQSWLNETIFIHTKTDDLQILTADTASYNLDANIDEIDNVFWRKDGVDRKLTPMTKEEYTSLSNKLTEGEPTRYYVDYQLAQPTLYLYPVYTHTTTVVTGTDSGKWLCKLDHTSATATNKPITGTSYTTDWETTTETANATWADATAYYSGRVHYTKLYKLQDIDANTNAENIDLKSKSLLAFIYSLAYEIALMYPVVSSNKRKEIFNRAEYLKMQMKNTDNESGDLIITPKMR